MLRRAENTRLAALLRQAGWSGQRLADAVNIAGAENGLALRYDRTSVAHWLSGSRPPSVVATLVAEVLSRHLERRVHSVETGLADTMGPTSNTEDVTGDVAAYLVRLGNAGSSAQRGALREVIYTAVEFGMPGMAELAATTSPPPARNGERVGNAQTKAATLMLSMFSYCDLVAGGGRSLPALSAYLATDVASWLRASATPSARARLYSAAARLTYLAGWMCFDNNLHGQSQRYYRTAAQLAAVGGDTSGYAAAMRSLSVQAYYLGHPLHALSLAEAAMAESRYVPRVEVAFLAGQLAVANAACGYHDVAHADLARAEHQLDREPENRAMVAGYNVAALLHQRAEILTLSGDKDAAIKALILSLRHRPPTERRARAITTARLAELYLGTGRVDHACATWATLLDERPQLSSGRVEQAVQSIRTMLRPHARYPGVLELIKRASTQPSVHDD